LSTLKKEFLSIKPDVFSGLSTATIALPQNMAYALILGINPIYGIYASIFSMLIATIFNHSNYIIVGPTNMMAVALASSLRPFQGSQYLEYIFLTTFLIGAFQFILVKLKLEVLIKYVSHPVVVALSHGAAILILFSQLENFTGIPISGNNVISKSVSFIQNIGQINFLSFGVGLFTLIVIFLINTFKPHWPEYLLTVIIVSFITYFTNIYTQIPLIGTIPKQIVDFNLIDFNLSMIKDVYSTAFSIALLGLIQTMAVLQAVSLKRKESINFTKDFTSQGLANMGTSFFSGFAISASFSNTFANLNAGAKSKMSQLFCALSIIVFILFLRPFLSFIPIAVLASLVIKAAISITNFSEIKINLKSTKGDALMLISTFLATIILPNLDQAIYLGVFVSLVVVIKVSEVADIDLLYSPEELSDDQINEDSINLEKTSIDMDPRNTRIVNIKGVLHFSTADHLRDELKAYFEPETSFIIRLRNVRRVDVTIVKVFMNFIEKVQSNGGLIMFAGVNEETIRLFNQLGLTDLLGKENIYKQEEEYLASTHKAVYSSKEHSIKSDENKNL
jgi:SulP family sulfate permease